MVWEERRGTGGWAPAPRPHSHPLALASELAVEPGHRPHVSLVPTHPQLKQAWESCSPGLRW